ncbi:hypothetical protein ABN764_24515 [Paenibacillaceae sp. P-4]
MPNRIRSFLMSPQELVLQNLPDLAVLPIGTPMTAATKHALQHSV